MIVDCAVYEAGQRSQQKLDLRAAYELGSSGDERFVWIGLHDPSPDEFDSVAREFDLHELAAEDATKPHQRPKLEVYGDTVFIVLRTIHYDESEEEVETGQIMIFAGPGFVITVRHGPYTDLHPVRQRVEQRPELLRCGPGAVVHAVIDRTVDAYEPVAHAVDQDIEEVEGQVFSTDRVFPTERIYGLQREVLELHRAIAPLVEPTRRLARAEFDFVHDDLKAYFGDVHDHVVRTNEMVETFRDLLHGILEANLAQVGVQQNDDMRRITAWVGILAVPTSIAGIYGMNFEHMPELKWEYGYPAVLFVIVTVCVSLYVYFKRAGWL